MTNRFSRRSATASLMTLVLTLSLSTLAIAAPDRNHGRGPVQANYRDRDDDRWGDRDRNFGELRRQAISAGTRAGFQAGTRDRFQRRSFNFRDERNFQAATLGYRRHLGSLDRYRQIFREAFAQGYSQGFRNGGSRW